MIKLKHYINTVVVFLACFFFYYSYADTGYVILIACICIGLIKNNNKHCVYIFNQVMNTQSGERTFKLNVRVLTHINKMNEQRM